MKRLSAAALCLLLSILFLSLICMPIQPAWASGENWLPGWTYRKSHVINQTTGANSNYQVPIIVINGSGTDSGNTTYINNKARSDWADLRFTSSDGSTLLSAWNQTQNNGVNITAWVKVPGNLTASNQTIYLYYGNASASSYWNLTATFVNVINDGTPNKLALPMDEGSDGATYDKSGNSNDGTISGATWVDGKYGKGLNFDGSGDYVTITHSASLLITNNLTVSLWFKVTSLPAIAGDLIAKGEETAEGDFQFRIQSDSTLRFFVVISGSKKIAPTYTFATTTWYYVVGIFDGSYVYLYINGNLIGSTIASGSIGNTANLFIGKQNFLNWEYYFNGTIDDVRIYNRALTAGEISDFYNNYPFEVPEDAETVGKTLMRKYVSPEPIHGSWGSEDYCIITVTYVISPGALLWVNGSAVINGSQATFNLSTILTFSSAAFNNSYTFKNFTLNGIGSTLNPSDFMLNLTIATDTQQTAIAYYSYLPASSYLLAAAIVASLILIPAVLVTMIAFRRRR